MAPSNITVADSISQNLNVFTSRLQSILDSTIQVRSEFLPSHPHGLPTPPSSPSLDAKKQRKDLAQATQSIRDLSQAVHGIVNKSDKRLMELIPFTETDECEVVSSDSQVEENSSNDIDRSVQDIGLRISNVLTSLGNMRRDMDKRLASLSDVPDAKFSRLTTNNKPARMAMQGNFVARWNDWWAFGTLAIWQVRGSESALDEEDEYQPAEDEADETNDYNDWGQQDDLVMDELVSMTESMLRLE